MALSRVLIAFTIIIPCSGSAWIADLGEPYPAFTPDGEGIIYTFDGSHTYVETYSVLINSEYENGYAWRKITRYERGSYDEWYSKLGDLAVSPDGEKIAYVQKIGGNSASKTKASRLFVADVGSGKYILAADGSIISSPAFSLDGSSIAYLLTNGSNTYVCIADVTGSDERAIADALDAGLIYTKDGGCLYYVAKRDRGAGIYKINADGTGEELLSYVPGRPTKIVMSPDGEKIAVVTAAAGDDRDIYLLNADGTGLMALVDYKTDDFDPAFTSDGEKVVYVSATPYEIEDYKDLPPDRLYVVNADGTGAKRITDNEHGELHPAISPDGKKICYLGYVIRWNTGEARKEHEIHLMNLDGSGDRILVPFGFQEI